MDLRVIKHMKDFFPEGICLCLKLPWEDFENTDLQGG